MLRVSRRANEWLLQRPVVLVYHRIASEPQDRFSLCVTPKHFAEHLEILNKYRIICGIQQICDPSTRRNRFVAITFDDGYADNLISAQPILQRSGMPATFFVVSGSIGSGEFWWDALDRLVFEPAQLPSTLALSIGFLDIHWRIATETCAGRGSGLTSDDQHDERIVTSRRELFDALYAFLLPQDGRTRAAAIGSLRSWAGLVDTPSGFRRALEWDELSALLTDKHMELGAHSVTHASLAAVSAAEQHFEICTAKAVLQDRMNRPIDLFAYPYGRPGDHTATTVRILQEAEYAFAFNASGGGLSAHSDPFEMPRVYVEDWDGEEFSRRLCFRT